MAAVVGYVLVSAALVHLDVRTGRTDLLDASAGPVLLAASPYLLLVLGLYWMLFDHDDPPGAADPDEPAPGARELTRPRARG